MKYRGRVILHNIKRHSVGETKLGQGLTIGQSNRSSELWHEKILLLHRVDSEHISFGINRKTDEAILTDRKLGFFDFSTRLNHTLFFDRTVVAPKVNNGAHSARSHPFHLDQTSGTAPSIGV